MRKILIAAIIVVFTAISANAQDAKITSFDAIVVSLETSTNTATITAGGHYWTIKQPENKAEALVLDWDYHFVLNLTKIEDSGRVKAGAVVLDYHITPQQAAKNVERMRRANLPPRK